MRADMLRMQALRLMRLGHYPGAVEQLRQALSLDPTDAVGHALLAICLQAMRRVHAAEYEAGQALSLAPELAYAHYAMAVVQTTRRQFRRAEEHVQAVLALEPADSAARQLLADIYEHTDRRAKVIPTLEEALQHAPEDPDLIAHLGEALLHAGRFDEAEAKAREALAIEAGSLRAIVLMGTVLLRRGEVQRARELALLVLQADANHGPALHLLCGIKMRSNLLLGLWWRFAVWMTRYGETRQLIILIGSYVVYAAIVQLLNQIGMGKAGTLITILWVVLCAYTWGAAGIFQRMVQKELQSVRLKPDF